MLVNYKDLIKNGIKEITFLFGEEDYFLDDAYVKILDSLSPDRANDYNFEKFNANEDSLSKIILLANSFPMMADYRVIAIKNFEKYFTGKKPKAEQYYYLNKYLLTPSPTTKLIIHCSDKKLFGTQRALNKIRNSEEIAKKLSGKQFPYGLIMSKYDSIEFEKIYPDKYGAWVSNNFRERGKSINNDAINLLISYSPESLRHLNNEIEKLDLYTAGKSNIDINDVNNITGQNRDFNIFELQKSIGKKDLNKSLYILENMLKNSRVEVFIVSMLTNYFNTLWQLIEINRLTSNKYDIARQLGVNPFFVDDYKKALNYYSSLNIENNFIYLCEADENLKISSGSNLFIMQELILKLIKG